MPHLPIDKVLYRLSEVGARPSIDLSARIPGTSRVERHKAKSARPLKAVVKGLARSAVVKQRVTKQEYHVRVKGSRDYVGLVRKQSNGKNGYGYRLKGAMELVSGFASQEAAVLAMLTHV